MKWRTDELAAFWLIVTAALAFLLLPFAMWLDAWLTLR